MMRRGLERRTRLDDGQAKSGARGCADPPAESAQAFCRRDTHPTLVWLKGVNNLDAARSLGRMPGPGASSEPAIKRSTQRRTAVLDLEAEGDRRARALSRREIGAVPLRLGRADRLRARSRPRDRVGCVRSAGGLDELGPHGERAARRTEFARVRAAMISARQRGRVKTDQRLFATWRSRISSPMTQSCWS